MCRISIISFGNQEEWDHITESGSARCDIVLDMKMMLMHINSKVKSQLLYLIHKFL